MALAYEDYPDKKIGADEVSEIKKRIRSLILDMSGDDNAPTFTGSWERDDALIIVCANEESAEWLKVHSPDLKTLERLVDRFLKNGPLLIYPLASSQYAYRESRSTDTALHHFVGRVEAQLEAKGYALGVFLDIERAFDSTSYDVIKEAMTRYDIPAALADWTQSMLTGKTLTASHEDSTVYGFPAKRCPQRGVLFHMLWCLVMDELLYKLQKKSFLVFSYADDVAIVVRGNFFSTLKETMEKALKITEDWCQLKGLRVNPSKTKAMIFTRKYKSEAIESLRLWHKEIEYVQSVKYLEIYLDTKLNWKTHLDRKRSKFHASYWACRRAMSKSWGIKLNTALWIYKAVLVPSLTYAAVVWWPRVEKIGTKNLLKSLQGNYLRAAVGAMRTTPTEALEVMLCIPPLDLTIVSAARLTAYRLRCQGEWRQFGLGHTRLEFLHKPPFTSKQDRISKRYQIQPGEHAWFTDGSGANGRFGAGIYCPGSNHREFFPLGTLATVFQAKVLAILECARLLLSRETKARKINIYTDSKAAIGALVRTTTESSVVWDCMQALKELGKNNKIKLIWVPGHQGIQGTEVADSLAKLGTLEEPVCQKVGVPFAVGKNYIRDWLKREHEASWQKLKSCRQAKALMTQPLPGRTKKLLTMSKYKQRLCIGLLTGHWAFRAHLFNLGLVEESSCRLCSEEKEDSVHILCRCLSLVLKRFRYFGSMFSEPEKLKKYKISHLCSLAANAGLNQFGR
ncbi:uncharacterized protein LOC109862388 [Pseudomyrmex gracilis]|uniref:uncharacterized protein LOC109862388 n=1 Tax=Pseudomyrmex gracilis TaxID=219809 RepID=UPI0009953247|nr:uncharacterized protein LOC109862388 [Pseudomyrmex gracilis]